MVCQRPVHGFGRVSDLVITQAPTGQLQPVQRALARQRLIQLSLAAEQPKQRIAAQSNLTTVLCKITSLSLFRQH
jgi:hypothetical protein